MTTNLDSLYEARERLRGWRDGAKAMLAGVQKAHDYADAAGVAPDSSMGVGLAELLQRVTGMRDGYAASLTLLNGQIRRAQKGPSAAK